MLCKEDCPHTVSDGKSVVNVVYQEQRSGKIVDYV